MAQEAETRRLGLYGPAISPIGLGGWEAGGGRTWGPNSSDDEVVQALRTGFALGVNWVDTAEVYAQGHSEELIGEALRGVDDVLVFTKVGPQPDGTGVRRREIVRAVEGSLRRLKRDVIDVYQVHWRDQAVPLDETWEAMAQLVDDGLVRRIGLSNFNASDVERCERIRHVDSVQPQASLLYPDELERLQPTCERFGIGTVCYGSLAFGLLAAPVDRAFVDWRSGTYNMDDFFVAENYPRFFAPPARRRQMRRIEAVRELAMEFDLTPAQVAIAWLLAQSGVTGAIIGSRSTAHIQENVAAATVGLTHDQVARITLAVAMEA
jgi:methylglyoxal reductase